MHYDSRQPTLFEAHLKGTHDGFHEQDSPEHVCARVRPKLAALLAEARAAERMPWSEQDARVNAMLFHNMANWLPEPDRTEQRDAFVAELARLHAAGAP